MKYNIRHKPLLTGALLVATGVGAVGITTGFVSAHGAMNQERISATLSEKLNVSESDVDTALQATREEMRQEQLSHYSDRLQELVDSGELTAEQKTLIENKREELQAQREKQHDEMEAWAEENGIDLSLIKMGGRGQMGHRHTASQ